MNQVTNNETVNKVVQQGRKIVNQANQRHIVIRKADGTTLADLSMTVLAIILVVLLMLPPFGFFVGIAAIAYGMFAKLKVEIVRELSTGDSVVEVNLPHNE